MSSQNRIRIIKALLILVLAISIPSANDRVRADIAPPDPPLGSDIEPSGEVTDVRMMSELVTIDVANISDYPSEHAVVTAIFYMRNLGELDEAMTVRFPLHATESDFGWEHCGGLATLPSLDNFRAWVNDRPVSVGILQETILNPLGHMEGEPEHITVPCWATFDVIFPAGEDVVVKVSYKASGYVYDENVGQVEFIYVLGTGAGWKDTIGQADVRVRLPYEVNNLNFIECRPGDCEISGKEITWFYEDFEPEGTVSVKIIKPSVWQRILTETEKTEINPNDGEAWGRLGKAYKEALMMNRGLFTYGPSGFGLYEKSKQAYQKTVSLLPNDADWHYGFAELLCLYAEWYSLGDRYLAEDWAACFTQIKQALDINPEHDRTNKMLTENGDWWESKGFIEIGETIDYLILTPQPTATPTEVPATQTLKPSPTLTNTPQAKTNTPTPSTIAENGIYKGTPTGLATLDLPEITETVVVPNTSDSEIISENMRFGHISTLVLVFIGVLIGSAMIIGILVLRKK